MHLPPYDVFPTILADRIILREIVLSDLDHILEVSFYDGKPAADTAEALVMLQRIERDYHNGDTIHWGIADKNSNIIMGTCGYYRGFQNGAGELDKALEILKMALSNPSVKKSVQKMLLEKPLTGFMQEVI